LSWRLDDSTPTDLAAPQNTEPPPNPLMPGMGLVHSTENGPDSPLLPTARPRSSTSASRHSSDEQTPLLYHRPHRPPTLTIYPPPPDPGTKNIWAELDDEGNASDQDILASLPRAPSPFLTHHNYSARRRSRGTSLSSTPSTALNSHFSRTRGSAGSADSAQFHGPRRAKTLQATAQKERRRSSAPGSTGGGGSKSPVRKSLLTDAVANGSAKLDEDGNGNEGQETSGRPSSSGAVANGSASVVPSRWDSGFSRWWQGKPKEGAGDSDPG